MNDTLEEQYIDPDDGRTEIQVTIPARTRNVLVQLTDINYRITRVSLMHSRKVYYFANNGGSQMYRGD